MTTKIFGIYCRILSSLLTVSTIRLLLIFAWSICCIAIVQHILETKQDYSNTAMTAASLSFYLAYIAFVLKHPLDSIVFFPFYALLHRSNYFVISTRTVGWAAFIVTHFGVSIGVWWFAYQTFPRSSLEFNSISQLVVMQWTMITTLWVHEFLTYCAGVTSDRSVV